MNWTLKAVFSISICMPTIAFCQAANQLTRNQVIEDLIRYEDAGYRPGVSTDAFYPADFQAAATQLSVQRTRVLTGNSESGRRSASSNR